MTLPSTSTLLIIDSVSAFRAPLLFFNRLSNTVVRMMARRGFHSIVDYLDDLLINGKTKAEC